MSTKEFTPPVKMAEGAQGLREIADWLDQHPEIEPWFGLVYLKAQDDPAAFFTIAAALADHPAGTLRDGSLDNEDFLAVEAEFAGGMKVYASTTVPVSA